MCQMSVFLDKDDDSAIIMENVSLLEKTGDGVTVSTLFEEPKTISGVEVIKIDFLSGKVILGSAH